MNRTVLIIFLFVTHFIFAQKNNDEFRAEASKELLMRGEYDLAIQWLEPYVNSDNYTRFDYSYLIAAYLLKEDYVNGLAYSNKWLNISLSIADTVNVINALNYKTDILYFSGDIEGSIEAAEVVLQYYTPKDSVRETVTNIRLGGIQRQNGNVELAYTIYSKIDLENVILAGSEAEYFGNSLNIYRDLGMVDSAIYCSNEALKYSSTFDEEFTKVSQYNAIAAIYIDAEDYGAAMEYLDSAIAMSLDKNRRNYEFVYENYAVVYNKLGMIDSALVYVHKLKDLYQHIFMEKMELDLKDLKNQYDLELKFKTEIIKKEEDLEKSKLQLLLSVIIILLIILIAAVMILFLRNKNLKTSRDNLLINQQLLRTQITPHFLFNSLATIQGMILQEESSKASNFLSKFSRLVRLVLNNSRDRVVSLSDELEAIKYYLELQNARFEKSFSFSIRLDKNIEDKEVLIPPMIIQPFVENCIEHGFKKVDRKGEIDIHVYFENDSLICKITDNGVGTDAVIPEAIVPKKESLSTKINMERMKLLAKEFKTTASLEIVDRSKYDAQGTIVTIEIPYKYD